MSHSRFVIDDQHMDTVTLLSDPDEEDDGEDELFNRDDGLTFDPRSPELEQMHIDDGLYSITPPSVMYRIAMTRYVWAASSMAALGGVLFGYDMGIVSGALLQLKITFSLSCFQQEMVVSSMLLGALFGSCVGGFIVDWAGRRLAIIINAFIFVIAAIMLATAHSYVILIIGRLVVGFAVSLSAIGECVYISEIAPVKRRGQLVSLNELGITIGLLVAYLVNYMFISTPQGWRYMFGLAVIPAVFQGVGMVFLPPSPRFLVQKGRDNEAHRVLQKLRGTSHVDGELNNIRTTLMNERVYSVFDLLRSVDNMRGRVLIGVGLVFFQQFTGQTNVLYYAPSVFQALGFQSNTSATLATVGLGLIKVLATTLCLLCVDKVGRRSLLLFGATSMMIIMITLGMVTLMINPVNSSPCTEEFLFNIPEINVTDAPSPFPLQKTPRVRNTLPNSDDYSTHRLRRMIPNEHQIDANTNSSILLSPYMLHTKLFDPLPSDQDILTKQYYQRKSIMNSKYIKIAQEKLHTDNLMRIKRSSGDAQEFSQSSSSLTTKSPKSAKNSAPIDDSLPRNDVTMSGADESRPVNRAAESLTGDNDGEHTPLTTVQYKDPVKTGHVTTGSVDHDTNDPMTASETSTQQWRQMKTSIVPHEELTTQDEHQNASPIASGVTVATTSTHPRTSPSRRIKSGTSGAAQAIAVMALMGYIAAYAIGFGPVTWLILSEIFPSGIRGRATAFASIFNWTTNLVVSATFLDIMSAVGTSWTFLTYSIICGVSVLFVFLVVPETQNKSLEQISTDLKKGSTIGRAFARCRHRTSCTLLCCCQFSISHSRLPVSDSQSDFGISNQVSLANTRL